MENMNPKIIKVPDTLENLNKDVKNEKNNVIINGNEKVSNVPQQRKNDDVTVLVLLNLTSFKNGDSIFSWLNQSYNSYNILFLAYGEDRENNFLNRIKHSHNNANIIYKKELNIFEEVYNIKDEYTIIASSEDFYPRDYLDKMLKNRNEADICISDTAVIYPDKITDEGIDLSVTAFILKKVSDDPFELLRENYNFFGSYFLGNKIIKTELLRKVCDEIADSCPFLEYEPNYAIFHLLVSCKLFAISTLLYLNLVQNKK